MSPNRSARSIQNIALLGLSNKTDALRDAYNMVEEHDSDKEMEFNYDLEAADKEEIKLAEMNTSIASLLSGRGRVSASSSIRKQRRPVSNMMPIKEEASEVQSKRGSMQVPASFEFGEI